MSAGTGVPDASVRSVPLPGPIEADPTDELRDLADPRGAPERVVPVGDVARWMLHQALGGIRLGAFDRQIVAWLAGRDAPTIATVASLLRRAWHAGMDDGRAETDQLGPLA